MKIKIRKNIEKNKKNAWYNADKRGILYKALRNSVLKKITPKKLLKNIKIIAWLFKWNIVI